MLASKAFRQPLWLLCLFLSGSPLRSAAVVAAPSAAADAPSFEQKAYQARAILKAKKLLASTEEARNAKTEESKKKAKEFSRRKQEEKEERTPTQIPRRISDAVHSTLFGSSVLKTPKVPQAFLPPVNFITLPNGTIRQMSALPSAAIEKPIHNLFDTSSSLMDRPEVRAQTDKITPYNQTDPTTNPEAQREALARFDGYQIALRKIDAGRILFTTDSNPRPRPLSRDALRNLTAKGAPFKCFEWGAPPHIAGTLPPSSLTPVEENKQGVWCKTADQTEFDIVDEDLYLSPEVISTFKNLAFSKIKSFIPGADAYLEFIKAAGIFKTIGFVESGIETAKAQTAGIQKLMASSPRYHKLLALLKDQKDATYQQYPQLQAMSSTGGKGKAAFQAIRAAGAAIPGYTQITDPYTKYAVLEAQRLIQTTLSKLFAKREWHTVVETVPAKAAGQTLEQYQDELRLTWFEVSGKKLPPHVTSPAQAGDITSGEPLYLLSKDKTTLAPAYFYTLISADERLALLAEAMTVSDEHIEALRQLLKETSNFSEKEAALHIEAVLNYPLSPVEEAALNKTIPKDPAQCPLPADAALLTAFGWSTPEITRAIAAVVSTTVAPLDGATLALAQVALGEVGANPAALEALTRYLYARDLPTPESKKTLEDLINNPHVLGAEAKEALAELMAGHAILTQADRNLLKDAIAPLLLNEDEREGLDTYCADATGAYNETAKASLKRIATRPSLSVAQQRAILLLLDNKLLDVVALDGAAQDVHLGPIARFQQHQPLNAARAADLLERVKKPRLTAAQIAQLQALRAVNLMHPIDNLLPLLEANSPLNENQKESLGCLINGFSTEVKKTLEACLTAFTTLDATARKNLYQKKQRGATPIQKQRTILAASRDESGPKMALALDNARPGPGLLPANGHRPEALAAGIISIQPVKLGPLQNSPCAIIATAGENPDCFALHTAFPPAGGIALYILEDNQLVPIKMKRLFRLKPVETEEEFIRDTHARFVSVPEAFFAKMPHIAGTPYSEELNVIVTSLLYEALTDLWSPNGVLREAIIGMAQSIPSTPGGFAQWAGSTFMHPHASPIMGSLASWMSHDFCMAALGTNVIDLAPFVALAGPVAGYLPQGAPMTITLPEISPFTLLNNEKRSEIVDAIPCQVTHVAATALKTASNNFFGGIAARIQGQFAGMGPLAAIPVALAMAAITQVKQTIDGTLDALIAAQTLEDLLTVVETSIDGLAQQAQALAGVAAPFIGGAAPQIQAGLAAVQQKLPVLGFVRTIIKQIKTLQFFLYRIKNPLFKSAFYGLTNPGSTLALLSNVRMLSNLLKSFYDRLISRPVDSKQTLTAHTYDKMGQTTFIHPSMVKLYTVKKTEDGTVSIPQRQLLPLSTVEFEGLTQLMLTKQSEESYTALRFEEKEEKIHELYAKAQTKVREALAALQQERDNAPDKRSKAAAALMFKDAAALSDVPPESLTFNLLFESLKKNNATAQREVNALQERIQALNRLYQQKLIQLQTRHRPGMVDARGTLDRRIEEAKNALRDKLSQQPGLFEDTAIEHAFEALNTLLDNEKADPGSILASDFSNAFATFKTATTAEIKAAQQSVDDAFAVRTGLEDSCLDAFVGSARNILVARPTGYEELLPVTDSPRLSFTLGYEIDWKQIGAKALKFMVASLIYRLFVKERAAFITEAIISNAETLAGLLSHVKKASKEKSANVNGFVSRFCTYVPLSISLQGNLKHVLLYLFCYEILNNIETKVSSTPTFVSTLRQMGKDLSSDAFSKPFTALEKGENPVAEMEKSLGQRLMKLYSTATQQPIHVVAPITASMELILGGGRFALNRGSNALISTIISKDFLDTPALEVAARKGGMWGALLFLNTIPPHVAQSLAKNSLVQHMIPRLRGTQIIPNFYSAPWFIAVKKFLTAFLTIRELDQSLNKRLVAHVLEHESLFKELLSRYLVEKSKGKPNKDIEAEIARQVSLSYKRSEVAQTGLWHRIKGKLGIDKVTKQFQDLMDEGLPLMLGLRSKAELTVNAILMVLPLLNLAGFGKYFKSMTGVSL